MKWGKTTYVVVFAFFAIFVVLFSFQNFYVRASFIPISILLFFAYYLLADKGKHSRESTFVLTFISIAFFLSIHLFGQGYKIIYVDTVLACAFASCVMILFTREVALKVRLLCIIPIIFSLYTLKEVGGLLALIAIVVVVIDSLVAIIGYFLNAGDRPVNFWKDGKGVCATLLLLVCLIVAPFISRGMWLSYCKRENIPVREHAKVVSGGTILDELKAPNGKSAQVLDSFKKAFVYKTIATDSAKEIERLYRKVFMWLNRIVDQKSESYQFSLWVALCVLLVAFFFLSFMQNGKNDVVRTFLSCGWLYFGFLLYIFGLIISYIFFFSDYEAVKLASYRRYIDIYFLALVLFILFLLKRLFLDKRSKSYKKYVCMSIIFAFVAIMVLNAKSLNFWKASACPVRNEMEGVLSKLSLPDKGRFFLVWQNSNGFHLNIACFNLYPRRVNNSHWSLGEPYHKGDIWTKNVSTQE